MICPKCGAEMRVVDSRPIEANSVRRRRACEECQYRLTTYEITQEQLGRFNRIERERGKILNTMEELISKYGGKSNE